MKTSTNKILFQLSVVKWRRTLVKSRTYNIRKELVKTIFWRFEQQQHHDIVIKATHRRPSFS